MMERIRSQFMMCVRLVVWDTRSRKILATRTHHMWVIDQDRKPIGVVSDTDIIRKVVGLED